MQKLYLIFPKNIDKIKYKLKNYRNEYCINVIIGFIIYEFGENIVFCGRIKYHILLLLFLLLRLLHSSKILQILIMVFKMLLAHYASVNTCNNGFWFFLISRNFVCVKANKLDNKKKTYYITMKLQFYSLKMTKEVCCTKL